MEREKGPDFAFLDIGSRLGGGYPGLAALLQGLQGLLAVHATSRAEGEREAGEERGWGGRGEGLAASASRGLPSLGAGRAGPRKPLKPMFFLTFILTFG